MTSCTIPLASEIPLFDGMIEMPRLSRDKFLMSRSANML